MPQSLVSVLEDPTRRKAVIADTVTLIESEHCPPDRFPGPIREPVAATSPAMQQPAVVCRPAAVFSIPMGSLAGSPGRSLHL